MFRPMKTTRKMDLLDHLLRMKDLTIPKRKHVCRPRAFARLKIRSTSAFQQKL